MKSFVEIQFAKCNHRINISTTKQRFDTIGRLGSLHWESTSMKVCRQTSWELRDEWSLVVAVTIDAKQVNGVISLWKESLDAETLEGLVVVGITKIEAYKRMIWNLKTSMIGATASTGWLAV
jgi:hypothetical protein